MGDIALVDPVAPVIVVEVMGKKSKQSSAAGMFLALPCLRGSPPVDAEREQLYGPFYLV